ncbi:hypothetical protein JTE90_013912 [Oedothorax gibbosus]|uniref:Uncharacterized protein n=1 Tax=Oedothorax gibbosus TaxID=931172 RepID=A0AAV6UF67_9ARAC|nr:hypothetical protein JTE90_013912 [Oedothorax gibbosus]
MQKGTLKTFHFNTPRSRDRAKKTSNRDEVKCLNEKGTLKTFHFKHRSETREKTQATEDEVKCLMQKGHTLRPFTSTHQGAEKTEQQEMK